MLRTLWNIAYSVGLGFFTNRLSTSAAAMAFYTMFAIGPNPSGSSGRFAWLQKPIERSPNASKQTFGHV